MVVEIFKNQKDYFLWRVEKVKRIAKRFPEVFRDVKGKKVLDIGCGAECPLSFYLTENGAKVRAGDVSKEKVSQAKKFAKKANISVFCAEKLPFKDKEFDFIYMVDVLEHVNDPSKAIKEAARVTKDGGKIFLEYSPFYAYPTGHHLYGLGFPKGLLPFQFMPRSLTKYLTLHSKLNGKDTPEFMFWQFDNLNRISVMQINKILRNEHLKKVDERYCISLPHGEIEVNFLRFLPILNELFTMSHSFVLHKLRA